MINKPQFVAKIRASLVRWRDANSPDIDLSMACLQHAVFTFAYLAASGRTPLLQAGTCSWPRINLKDDDGVMATHFTYQWEPESVFSQLAQAIGGMPEMHVWIYLQDSKEVVDLTTRYLKQRCEANGITWLAPDPPDYLWSKTVPRGVYYVANKDATKLALEYASDIVRKLRISKRS